MKRDDGGPAFPGTLRDWFAGQVLAGISTSYADQQDEARWAYSVADAMIAERAKVELTYEPVPGRNVTVCDYADCGEDALPGKDDNGMHGCEVHFMNAAKMERGQAPDPPAAARDTVAVQPAPASDEPRVEKCPTCDGVDPKTCMRCRGTGRIFVDPLPVPAPQTHCLNCGLVLDSARDYCLVCGCEAWLFSQRESDIKCTLRAGHDGDHLNGAVSWGGSS